MKEEIIEVLKEYIVWPIVFIAFSWFVIEIIIIFINLVLRGHYII